MDSLVNHQCKEKTMSQQDQVNEKREAEDQKKVSRRDAIKRMAKAAGIAALPIAAGSLSCVPYCSYYSSYSGYYYYYSEYCSLG